MEPSDYSVPKKSRRFLWVIAGAVAVLLIAAIAVYMAIGTTEKESASTDTSSSSSAATVATNEEVKRNLSALDASIKQAATDQATAKAALEDSKKQIKVAD